MTASISGDVREEVGRYLRVFAALLVLTGVTVGASYFHLVAPLAITVALVIATLKGSLVVSFFMHLVGERPVIFAALALTAVLLTALIALPLLVTNDQIGTPSTVTVSTQTQLEH